MRRTARIALIALGCGALWSCADQSEPGDDSEAADGAAVETSSDVQVVPCGSLEPLLAALPAAQTVGDLPEAYRHCDPSGFGVAVGYGQGGERFLGYEFTVRVLDSNSAYAASSLNPDGAGADARELMKQSLISSGEVFRSMLTICEGYVRNPLITDGRNPIIVPVNGVDVCIRDELDPNREIWNAFGVAGGLGYHLTLRGQRARAIETTEAASAHLAPLFALFRM
jgi:hypothetical protein